MGKIKVEPMHFKEVMDHYHVIASYTYRNGRHACISYNPFSLIFQVMDGGADYFFNNMKDAFDFYNEQI